MRNGKSDTEKSEQRVLNWSFDEVFKVLATIGLGYDGASVQRNLADNLATKVTTGTNVIYVGVAPVGTAEETAKWLAYKVDTSSGVVVTYADGNADFDNVATDLTSLSYS